MKKVILFFSVVLLSVTAFAQPCSNCPVPVTGQQQQVHQPAVFVGTAISNSPLIPGKAYKGIAYIKMYTPDFTQTVSVSVWIMGKEFETVATIPDWATPNCWSCLFKVNRMARMNPTTGGVEYVTHIPVRIQQLIVGPEGDITSAQLQLR